MLDIKKNIDNLLAEIKDLPEEERQRQLLAYRTELDAVITPPIVGPDVKIKTDANPVKDDNESEQEKRVRLFGNI